ncbi:MAG: CBS domain-containing protein, partial [Oscillospiraceae bacterium]
MDDTVDFIEEMPANIVKRVLKMSDADARKKINQILMYPDSSAGSLMTIEFMEVDIDWTVEYAIRKVRQQAEDKEAIDNLFVTDEGRHLKGSLKLSTLLSANDEELVNDLIEKDVMSVTTHQNQEEVAEIFKKYDLYSMPVVDTEGRLVGLITID